MTRSVSISLRLLFPLLIATFIYACKSGSTDAESPMDSALPTGATPGVYISGFTLSKDSSGVASIWKDGIKVSLKGSKTTNMVEQNGDIYLAGVSGDKTAYWKNGILTILKGPAGMQDIRGMAVSGSDVYVLSNIQGNSNGKNTITNVLWKNGVATTLPSDIYPLGIAASGSDVYLCGNMGAYIGYMKNGVIMMLPNCAAANAITIINNDVYIAGAAITSLPGSPNTTACYWKNGVLFYCSGNGRCLAIQVKGTDVYTAGAINGDTQAAYWKNGVITTIPNSLVGTAIFVDNKNDVYVAGKATDASLFSIVATCWKNGTQVFKSTEPSYALGVAVIN